MQVLIHCEMQSTAVVAGKKAGVPVLGNLVVRLYMYQLTLLRGSLWENSSTQMSSKPSVAWPTSLGEGASASEEDPGSWFCVSLAFFSILRISFSSKPSRLASDLRWDLDWEPQAGAVSQAQAQTLREGLWCRLLKIWAYAGIKHRKVGLLSSLN